MGSIDSIRVAFERNARACTARPGKGQKTFVAKVRVQDGLTCAIEEGPWRRIWRPSSPTAGAVAMPSQGSSSSPAVASADPTQVLTLKQAT